MGRTRSRSMLVLAVLLMVLAACGGGGDGSSADDGESADPQSAGTTDSGDDQGSGAEDVDAEDPPAEAPGERSAVITIDGESQNYAVDDVIFSQVEGMDDLTFETCSPDFFGSGRFYAIGYAVDGAGEVIVGDDGGPAGTFTMDLPPDDWEAAQRDAPDFDIQWNDLDIEIATPDEAAGGTMSWTIGDTTASGEAVFVDFEQSYTVQFDLVCEGSPTVAAGDLPTDDDSDDDTDSGGGGFPLAGAGVGSFTADGESFDSVDVYSCEPFSFGDQGPDPEDLSLLAYLGGTSGLEVEISRLNGDGLGFHVFYSRQGANGLEQFEGGADNSIPGSFEAGPWHINDSETFEQTELAEAPYQIEGNRITGSLEDLIQTWPDEGAATVDVTFDLEIPSEINEEC